jgi:hypothetical protein
MSSSSYTRIEKYFKKSEFDKLNESVCS